MATTGTKTPAATKGRRKFKMTDEHKERLAEGRNLSRSVSQYLDALDKKERKKRGRQRTRESAEKQLAAVVAELKSKGRGSGNPTRRLELIQRKRDLEVELAVMANGNTQVDLSALEADFIKHAPQYAAKKGITFGAFREFGVPPAVLAKAGIKRGS